MSKTAPLQLPIAIFLTGYVLACSGEEFAFSNDDEGGDKYDALLPNGKADGTGFSNEPLMFSNACADGEHITIAAGGDLLIHGRLQKQALAHEDGFISLWSGISDLLEATDITYLNLEGPTARGVDRRGKDVPDPGKVFDDVVYSSYPMFNYHPSLTNDLKRAGVDVVSTANNHSLDRRSLGADRTLEALDAQRLAYTGTRRAGDTDSPWFATTTTDSGIKLAWLACTYSTNGIPDNDKQVLFCFEDTAFILDTIKILANKPDIDAVMVTPHWGAEYTANPSNQQIRLAYDMLDAGATAVIGAHPHVLQPWERYITEDGRETFVIYSLGNFVSGQRHLPRRTTILLYLGLVKKADDSVHLTGARYVPLHMTSRPDGFITLESIDRVGAYPESRALTTDMFGEYNLQAPDTQLVINPECE